MGEKGDGMGGHLRSRFLLQNEGLMGEFKCELMVCRFTCKVKS
jgi:hypothetical protein